MVYKIVKLNNKINNALYFKKIIIKSLIEINYFKKNLEVK